MGVPGQFREPLLSPNGAATGVAAATSLLPGAEGAATAAAAVAADDDEAAAERDDDDATEDILSRTTRPTAVTRLMSAAAE